MSHGSMRHPHTMITSTPDPRDGEPARQPENLTPEEADAHEQFLTELAIELRWQEYCL